jgi:hypothetical protein
MKNICYSMASGLGLAEASFPWLRLLHFGDCFGESRIYACITLGDTSIRILG